jgi:hypothetical protein
MPLLSRAAEHHGDEALVRPKGFEPPTFRSAT